MEQVLELIDRRNTNRLVSSIAFLLRVREFDPPVGTGADGVKSTKAGWKCGHISVPVSLSIASSDAVITRDLEQVLNARSLSAITLVYVITQ